MEEKYEINNTKIPVSIIKRIIYDGNSPTASATNQMTTVLTRSGYILNHSSNNTISNKMVIKKSMRVTENGCVDKNPVMYKKNNWNKDIRLKSICSDKIVSNMWIRKKIPKLTQIKFFKYYF